MLYEEFLTELKELSERQYAEFHKKLLNNPEIRVLGVRVPIMRKLAKKHYPDFAEFMRFPDEYYEVTFVKVCIASMLPYEEFISTVENIVPLLNNWATCDCFTPDCIKGHNDEFLPLLRKFAKTDKEFTQRFALTTLLHYYVEPGYTETIFSIIELCDTRYYYVSMAAAWLLAEVLVKQYDCGKSFLMEHSLDKRTHNTAIRKACESYRLSGDRKNYLKGLKR